MVFDLEIPKKVDLELDRYFIGALGLKLYTTDRTRTGQVLEIPDQLGPGL